MVETELTETGLVLARRGQDALGSSFEQPCYRIPALAVTASGRLLAAWDVRADWRDLPGPFDLILANPPYIEADAALARQVMEHEPATHAAIESWRMMPDYKQFLADAMAWRGYQARRKRLTSAGFGKSPLRQEK